MFSVNELLRQLVGVFLDFAKFGAAFLMSQAFEAIALKTRWSPFLKSLLPLVLSQFKNWVLPESESIMLYSLEVGATEPGKLNIATFQPPALSITMNPYQGLK